MDGQTGHYCAGMQIPLTATPQDGYRFVKWEISGGSIDNTANPEVIFTMGDEAVTITAVFESLNAANNTGGSNLRLILLISICALGAIFLFGFLALILYSIRKIIRH